MNILMLTHRLPYAPNRGDRIRAYYMLRFLSAHARVHLLSLVHDQEEASHAKEIGNAASLTCVRVPYWTNRLRAVAALPLARPLTHVLHDGQGLQDAFREALKKTAADVVLAYCTGMARLVVDTGVEVPLVLDMVDVDSAKWQQLSHVSKGLMRWLYAREGRLMREFEARAVRRATVTTVVNNREREALRRITSSGTVEVIPNGLDVSAFQTSPRPEGTRVASFCGVFDYAPNENAALWLVREIWPLVRREVPDASLLLVGANPTKRLKRQVQGESSVHLTGSVPEVLPYLARSTVSVAPLLTARGIQNKVLEALAAGLPVVTTSSVIEGLPPGVRGGCVCADDTRSIADALIELLRQSPSSLRGRASAADLSCLSWEQQLRPLLGGLRMATGRNESACA